jgi:hypothetical protein
MLALAVAVQPAQLRLQSAGVTATVTVSAAADARLSMWCSTGELSAPVASGPGTFTATYRAPATGRPQRVLIAAWDTRSGEAARTSVALIAHVTVPVETEPGALVTLLLHGRRTWAHANAAGVAHVGAWVGPDERTATVIARDAAGNTTTTEMPLDLPRAPRLFLFAPDELAPGAAARVFAFAVGEGTPTLATTGGTLEQLQSRPGITTAILHTSSTSRSGGAARDMALTATIDDTTATRVVRLPAVSAGATTETALSDWELGAAVGGGYGGGLGSLALAVELRRRLGSGRFAVGLDVDARYAAGTVDNASVMLGGAALRLVGEVRFRLRPRLLAGLAVAVGGTVVRERRVAPSGADATPGDGGPAIGATGALLVRLGPGWLTIAAGYSWAPLMGLSLANSDGVILTLGYRAARWPRRRRRGARRARRDDGTPGVHRRRPAPAA